MSGAGKASLRLRWKRAWCGFFGHDEQPWSSFTVCGRCDWDDKQERRLWLAAFDALKEWEVRGDGGCQVSIQKRLREALHA